jgi:hypothetical protein
MTVYTFRCAGCGKQHVVNDRFRKDYSTQCLRCGEAIEVTRLLIHSAEQPAVAGATARRPDEAVTTQPNEVVEETTALASDEETEVEARPKRKVPLAEVEPAEEITEAAPEPRKKKKKKRIRRRGEDPGPEDDEDDIPDAEDASPARRDRPSPESSARPPWLWPSVGSAVVIVLVLLGGGAYFLFNNKTPPTQREAAARKPPATKKESTSRSSSTTQLSTEKKEEKPAKPREPDFRIAATRLSAELATNTAEANDRYKDKWLEVSGLPAGVEPRKPPQTTARPHFLFACDGIPICCDVESSATPLNRWKILPADQPVTLRGTYSKDGFLSKCELAPPAAPADGRFKGKELEVTGVIKQVFSRTDRPFPAIELEGDTDGLVPGEFFFGLSEEDEIKKYQPGLQVIIRGTCAGRESDARRSRAVRFHNCQMIFTSGPPPSMSRVPVVEVLRAFEEDLRPEFLPPPGSEIQVAGPLTLGGLGKEWAADPQALAKQYRNKVLTVSGKLLQREASQLVLTSGATDQPLQVRCFLDRSDYESYKGVKIGADIRIRGRCSGLTEKILRLDSCQDPDAVRDPRRVTLDYFPHQPGRQLTYDIATYPTPNKKEGPVKRVVYIQEENGKTESLVTHTGNLSGKTLLDPEEGGKWVSQKKTKAVTAPGPTLLYRVSGGFVEIGQQILDKTGRKVEVWERVLKIGARTGETWTWTQGAVTHEFTIDRFEDREGRAAVVVKEIVTNVADLAHPLESRHVYVRDVGEVEEQQWQRLTVRDRVLVGETRLVEDAKAAPRKEPGPGLK